MSDPVDPPRLADPGAQAPDGLRDLFSAAMRDLPSAAELAPLRARLDTALAPGAPGGSMLARLGGAKGVIAATLGAAALAVLALWLVRGRPAPTPPAQPPPARTAISELPAPAPRNEPAQPLQGPAADAPRDVELAPAPASAPRKSATPARPTEAALLETARAVLASQPARALSLTREHARLYPSGVLAQEREVIAIEALRRLGDERGAEERAGRFRRTFPSSPHRRSVDPTQR